MHIKKAFVNTMGLCNSRLGEPILRQRLLSLVIGYSSFVP